MVVFLPLKKDKRIFSNRNMLDAAEVVIRVVVVVLVAVVVMNSKMKPITDRLIR